MQSDELRNVNNLTYELPTCPDVCANATTNVFNFNPNSYENTTGGDVMQVEFAEGMNYIDPQESFIRLKLNVNYPGGPSVANRYAFGSLVPTRPTRQIPINSGESVMNLISSVELVSKSGETFFRELHKNQMQTVREYKINKSRKNYLTMMGGVNDTGNKDDATYPFYLTNNNCTFYIPLSEISPFFNGQYIPYKLLSGAVLRLTLAPIYTAVLSYKEIDTQFQEVDKNPATTATLSNMALILSEKELYPEIKDKINKQINSPSGLQYAYYTNYNISYKFPSSSILDSYSIPINLSAGKIKYLAIKPVPNVLRNSALFTSADWTDFQQSQVLKFELPFKIKIRLGNDVLSTYDVSTIPEMYEQTIKTLNNISFSNCEDVDTERCINKKAPSCVGGGNYAYRAISELGDTGGLLFAFDFERMQSMGVSGLSTNQERLLSVDVSDYRSDRVLEWYFNIQYLVVATIYSDGSIAVNK